MSASVNIWVIVGESNAGKSTSIRALTGVRDQNIYTLSTTAGISLNNVLIVPSSLQEYYQITPANFIKRVQDDLFCAKTAGAGAIHPSEYPSGKRIDNVLVSLRQNGTNGCPDAADYIAEFAAAGWHVQVPIVHLQLPGYVFHPAPPHISIDIAALSGGALRPSNEKASIIRTAWGWL